MIRTGWGRSYFQEIFGNTFNNTANNYPTLITQTVQQPNLYTPVFTLNPGSADAGCAGDSFERDPASSGSRGRKLSP